MWSNRDEVRVHLRNYGPLVVIVAVGAGLWSLIEGSPAQDESATASPDRAEEEPEPTLGELYQLPAEPASVKVTRFQDVKVMPSRELVIGGNTQPFEVRPLPRPQKLLTGKNLWLEGDLPIAKDRVFLNVTSKASEFSPPTKVLLVDLQSGTVVGTYDRVFGQYRSFGVAWGREKDPATGQTRRVLIHASDGLAIPVEEYGAVEDHRLLVFNAGFGFAVIIQPDDPVSRTGTSHYAVWHDLRSPPPPLTEALPFVPLPSDPDEDEWFFETPLGLNPYEGPTLLWGEHPPETCKRASFWPSESRHRCHQREHPLNAEWSLLKAEFRSPLAIYNHRTGVLEVLDLVPEPCFTGPGYDIGVRDPLRILLSCSGFGQLLWTPEGLFRKPEGRLSEAFVFSWNRNRTMRATIDINDTGHVDTEWLEMLTPQRFTFSPPYHEPLYTFVRKERTPTIFKADPNRIWSLNLLAPNRVIRDKPARCAEIEYESHSDDWWTYSCRNRYRVSAWVDLVNLATEARIRLGRAKDVLIDSEANHLLLIRRAGTQDVLFRAPLPAARP